MVQKLSHSSSNSVELEPERPSPFRDGSMIEIFLHTKYKILDLEQVVQGSQFESAVAVAMRVVILREGLAMEAFVSYL